MALSKANIKHIQSLQQKKFRQRNQSFVIEGTKIAKEVLLQKSTAVKAIYATQIWVDSHRDLLAKYTAILTVVSSAELKKISNLKTPQHILIELGMTTAKLDAKNLPNTLCLALENIQDPGNMGTIIRIADWFGIRHIFCSIGCVDIYNPKVLQATMGSFLRAEIHYTDLKVLFEAQDLPIYGAVLGGKNVLKTKLQTEGFLLIGNEGRGISEELQSYITEGITIPSYGNAESLNAAVATGILCAMFRANEV